VAKPSYRAFELLHALGNELVSSWSNVHPTVDAWLVRGEESMTVMITNHALPRHPIATERVRVSLDGLRAPRAASIARIDAEHANAKAHWLSLGEPAYPSVSQVDAMHDASTVRAEPQRWTIFGSAVRLECDLPPNSVAAITLDCARDDDEPLAHRAHD
jgi:xylan 1,4-beta-xylosidase